MNVAKRIQGAVSDLGVIVRPIDGGVVIIWAGVARGVAADDRNEKPIIDAIREWVAYVNERYTVHHHK